MGGSGGTFSYTRPDTMNENIRESSLEAAESTFGPEQLNLLFTDYLSQMNNRDVESVQQKLQEVKDALSDEIEDSIDLKFGGSVQKHTYVDGLSDIDTLLVLKSEEGKPSEILEMVKNKLSASIEDTVEVTQGSVAITVKYNDGTELQIVPAVKDGEHSKVPAWSKDEWSKIHPRRFATKLSEINSQCNGQLVPVIKLAKAVNATLPETQQLKGYHIESLAIEAFKGYSAPFTKEKMLPHFFRKSSDIVTKPIKDKSGQSVHVDEYLGPANGELRRNAQHLLKRIATRMENATLSRSVDQWKSLFGDEFN